ncbi:MAG: hypothetical protein WBQ54_11180 [Pseudolabrys sp.]
MDHQRTGRHSAFLRPARRQGSGHETAGTRQPDFVVRSPVCRQDDAGGRRSVLGRLTATKRASGQAISYRIAHFIQFRDEKVVDYVSIIDSFDAVEQLLRYSLDAYDGYRVEGDIVTV